MTWIDKFNEMRRSSGMSLDELSSKSGIPKGTLSKITSGITKAPALETMRALVYAMGYTLDDLADDVPAGRDSFTDAEKTLIKKYRTLDRYGKDAVSAILSVEHQRCEDRPQHDRSNLIPLPRSVQSVSAGTGAYLGPEEMETVFVEDTPLTRRASFLVSVAGNSMEPRYHDGDILIVEGAEDIALGEIGVFTMDGDGYVKQRGRGVLISLNPDYSPVPMTEDTWCNGRVIGVLDPSDIARL